MARSVLGAGETVRLASPDNRAEAAAPTSTIDTLATVTGAAGGLALVMSALLAWPGDGPGSTVAAHRFAELLLSDVAAAWIPRWLGLVVYVVPLGGAVVMVASGLGGRLPAAIKVLALVPAAAVTLATVVLLPKRSPIDLGPGALLALAGSLITVLSIVLDRWPHNHPTTASQTLALPANDGQQAPAKSQEDSCSA